MIEKLNTNTKLPSAPSEAENPMVALNEIFALLNEAMHESAMVQGQAASDLGKGMQNTAELLHKLNDSVAALQGKIQAANSSLESLRPWMIGLGVAASVLMLGTPLLAGYVGASVMMAGEAVGSLAAVAGGGVGIAGGVYSLQVADATHELAGKNGAVSEMSGSMQNTQATSKWMTNQMGETFSRKSDMARTVVQGTREIAEGIRIAANDAVRGVMGG